MPRASCSLLIVLLMASAGGCGTAIDGANTMRNGLTSVHFGRSGGLVAIGRPLRGDVAFDPGVKRRLSDSSVLNQLNGYRPKYHFWWYAGVIEHLQAIS